MMKNKTAITKLYVKADGLCQRVREVKNSADRDNDIIKMARLINALEQVLEIVEA